MTEYYFIRLKQFLFRQKWKWITVAETWYNWGRKFINCLEADVVGVWNFVLKDASEEAEEGKRKIRSHTSQFTTQHNTWQRRKKGRFASEKDTPHPFPFLRLRHLSLSVTLQILANASISIPILFSSLRLSLLSQPWRTPIFRGSIAPSRTTIGVCQVTSPRLPDSTRSIPRLNYTRRTLSPSFGWVPTIQALPFWPPPTGMGMGSPLRLGFRRTLMCSAIRFFTNGVLISLSCSRCVLWIPFCFCVNGCLGYGTRLIFFLIFFACIRCCLWGRPCLFRLTRIKSWQGLCISCTLICIKMPITNLRWLLPSLVLRLSVDSSLSRYYSILWIIILSWIIPNPPLQHSPANLYAKYSMCFRFSKHYLLFHLILSLQDSRKIYWRI